MLCLERNLCLQWENGKLSKTLTPEELLKLERNCSALRKRSIDEGINLKRIIKLPQVDPGDLVWWFQNSETENFIMIGAPMK